MVVGGGIVAGGLQARRGAAGAEENEQPAHLWVEVQQPAAQQHPQRALRHSQLERRTVRTRAPNHDIITFSVWRYSHLHLGSDMLHRVYR